MDLTIRSIPADARTAKMAVGGRLDSVTFRQLEESLTPFLNGSVDTVILDLSDLSFISSAGLRVLMTATNELAERNGSLLLTNLQPQILKVVEIIKVMPGVGLFASTEEMDQYLSAMQKKVVEQELEKKRKS